MDLEKLPLAQRIQRCQEGRTAYPEYIPSIIRAFGELPLAEYLSEPERQRLLNIIGYPDYPGWTFQWAALRIREMGIKNSKQAAEAMRILAKPMERYNDFAKKMEAMSRG